MPQLAGGDTRRERGLRRRPLRWAWTRDTYGTDDLSIVLEGLLNELGIADLSTFEALLLHDTGAVLDAIRSTAAAAEAGVAAYASSATSNVVVSPGSTATAGVISAAQG